MNDNIISAIVSDVSVIPGVFEPGKKVYLMASSHYDQNELESVLNRTLQHQRQSIKFLRKGENGAATPKESIDYENPGVQ
jgi:hypothetical protein